MIPKKIFQTWSTKELPTLVKDSVDKMLSLNKDYKYFIFDDFDLEFYVKSNFGGEIFEAFDMLTIGAAKADLWRYLVLYKEGGVYLDMDSEILLNLDGLINDEDEAIITRERNPNKFVQWCLIFNSGHPILKICIDKCVKNILSKKTENILKLTGPDVFSESIYEYVQSLGFDLFMYRDELVNPKLSEKNLQMRIFGFDYENFCNFKGSHSNQLYTNKDEWRVELTKKSLFKNNNIQ